MLQGFISPAYAQAAPAAAPVFGGRRGNPVLWARRFFPDLMAIEGDVGARHLIDRYGEVVAASGVKRSPGFAPARSATMAWASSRC